MKKNFKAYDLKSKIIMSIVHNRILKSVIRWYISTIFSKKRKQVSTSRFKNRCVLTKRSRGVYRFARLSRLFLRDPLYIGTLPGIRKSYW